MTQLRPNICRIPAAFIDLEETVGSTDGRLLAHRGHPSINIVVRARDSRDDIVLYTGIYLIRINAHIYIERDIVSLKTRVISRKMSRRAGNNSSAHRLYQRPLFDVIIYFRNLREVTRGEFAFFANYYYAD